MAGPRATTRTLTGGWPPEARVLLSRFDEKSVHYEAVTNQG